MDTASGCARSGFHASCAFDLGFGWGGMGATLRCLNSSASPRPSYVDNEVLVELKEMTAHAIPAERLEGASNVDIKMVLVNPAGEEMQGPCGGASLRRPSPTSWPPRTCPPNCVYVPQAPTTRSGRTRSTA